MMRMIVVVVGRSSFSGRAPSYQLGGTRPSERDLRRRRTNNARGVILGKEDEKHGMVLEAPICMLMKARALRVSIELRAMLLKVLVSKGRTAVASGIMNGTGRW